MLPRGHFKGLPFAKPVTNRCCYPIKNRAVPIHFLQKKSKFWRFYLKNVTGAASITEQAKDKSVLCFLLWLLGTIVVCFLQRVWCVELYPRGPSVHWCPWIVLQLQGPVVWHLVCLPLGQLDMGGLGLNWLFCYVRLSDNVDDPSFWYPRPKDGRVSVIIIR